MLSCLSELPVFYGWMIETIVSIIAYVYGFVAWFAHQNKRAAIIAFLVAMITAGYGWYPFSRWLAEQNATILGGECITEKHFSMAYLLHGLIGVSSALLLVALLVTKLRSKKSR